MEYSLPAARESLHQLTLNTPDKNRRNYLQDVKFMLNEYIEDRDRRPEPLETDRPQHYDMEDIIEAVEDERDRQDTIDTRLATIISDLQQYRAWDERGTPPEQYAESDI